MNCLLLSFALSLFASVYSLSESNEDFLEETTTSTAVKTLDTSVNDVITNSNKQEWTHKLIPPYQMMRTMTSPTQVSSTSPFSRSNAAIKSNPSTSYEFSFRNEADPFNRSGLLPSLQQQAYALYLERVRRKKTLHPLGIMRWDNRPAVGQQQVNSPTSLPTNNYFSPVSPFQRQFTHSLTPQQQGPQVLLPPPPSPPSSSTSAQLPQSPLSSSSNNNNGHSPDSGDGRSGQFDSPPGHKSNSVTAGVKVEDVTRDPLEAGYELLLYNRFQELCLQIRGYRCDSGKTK